MGRKAWSHIRHKQDEVGSFITQEPQPGGHYRLWGPDGLKAGEPNEVALNNAG